ncbi:hypothetical protein N7490_008382 [Penicillium lividum]|nr:hypothetical protein N7490_008382 [Penicillium lividum]
MTIPLIAPANLTNPWPTSDISTNSPAGAGNTRPAQAQAQRLGSPWPLPDQGYLTDNEPLRMGGRPTAMWSPRQKQMDCPRQWKSQSCLGWGLHGPHSPKWRTFTALSLWRGCCLSEYLWGKKPQPVITVLVLARREKFDDAQQIRQFLLKVANLPFVSVEIADPRLVPTTCEEFDMADSEENGCDD